MFRSRGAAAREFNRSKAWAIGGLTLGFLVWQVGFMSIGGEWFGMWMSSTWNGLQSAFRVFITIVGVLIFVSLRDGELEE
jgi:predicted small integral membrane protein